MRWRTIILLVVLPSFLIFESCSGEKKKLEEEIKILKEENAYLKAENRALKKEIEELYKRLEERKN
jgi:cell division protein FtsB